MSSVVRRIRVVLALAVFVAAVVAWPGVASADLTISGATIEGGTSTSSPPGGVLPAEVKGSGGGDQWGGTEYRFGSGDQECVNTNNSTGSQTVNFNVTAPGQPGSYDAGFTARTNGNPCGGAESPEKVLTDALNVTDPGPNPDLRQCGINVILVLDESGSIDTSGATEKVRRASRAFLNALSETGSQVSIVDFSTNAARPVAYTPVNGQVAPDGSGGTGTIGEVFEPYLKNQYNPSGWTNWEDAFTEVKAANDATPVADLVVFITDGDPTARNTDTGGTVTNLVEGDVEALRRAAKEADLVKAQGSKVFAVGVGAAVTKATSARRLTAVSGLDQYPQVAFAKADYTLVENFNDLAQALREIVAELCGAGITVTKYVDKGDGKYVADKGWAFTAKVSVPGGFEWVRPPSGTGASATEFTDDNGIAKFLWRPTDVTAASTVQVLDERSKPGYSYVTGGCTRKAVRRNRWRTFQRTSQPIVTDVVLQPGEFLTCAVYNKINPGTIVIEKEATPESSQAFDFTGSLGPFALVDERGDEAVSRTFPNLTPGRYTVTEMVPPSWELTGISCTPASAATITGAQVAITLASEASVTCTYKDRRLDTPIPPEPPEPPDPPSPPGPQPPPTPPPPPPTPPPSTQLQVEKTMPRIVRVGQRVRFRLTVTNTGTVAARRVQMADVPPAAIALASFRSSSRARVVRRNAIWALGTLQPGASRTVVGSVRIKAGTPGRKINHVLATAVNSQLVDDRAPTRLLPQRRRAQPVTG